ncbi:MAG: hypothetical protein DRQ97_08505 [Gammaproteobacteria bacterium]|nr:MAG: hypothetical protein DRQ97_08505 [Gammaproteobacteria bacterium]
MDYTIAMKRFRHLITSLLLLACMGQSLAAVAMPCFTMSSAPGEMSAAMVGMDHSDHHMASVEQTSTGGESCCDSGGFCSMSQCQAVVALVETTLSDAAIYAAMHNDALLFSLVNASSASRYRPPISR